MAYPIPSTSDLEDNYIHSDDTHHDEGMIESRRRSTILRRVVHIGTGVLILCLFGAVIHLSCCLFKSKKAPKFTELLELSVSHPHFSGKLDPITRKTVVKELTEMHSLGGISDDAWTEVSSFLEFEELARKFSKSYDSISSKHHGYINFKENLKVLESHKSEDTSYQTGMNQFFDKDMKVLSETFLHPLKEPVGMEPKTQQLPDVLVTEDKKLYYSMLKGYGIHTSRIRANTKLSFEDIDWRNMGVVSPVKDQKSCGSCWAFAAVGAVESTILQETPYDYSLSEQEIVNCEKRCFGCQGGYSDIALEYIMTSGVTSTEKMPYDGYESQCKIVGGDRHYIRNYVFAFGKSIASKLLVRAPTVVYIAVTQDLMFYRRGIYNGDCDFAPLNHAVLLVGEGYDPILRKRYWLLKNSWGTDWGEDGYFRIERTDRGTDKCGVLSFGFMPYGYQQHPSTETKANYSTTPRVMGVF